MTTPTPDRAYKYLDLVTAGFVTVLLVSNIASAAKLVDWGVSIWGLPLAFDAGTLLFPISYIFGDVLTEVYGYRRSRRVIWIGFACAALMGVTFWVVARLPGDPVWGAFVAGQIPGAATSGADPVIVGQSAYDAILGGVSSLAIIAASLVAYAAGEFTNSYILARMKVLTQGRHLWMRTIGSTLVGQGVDTTIFVLVATALGVFPPEAVLSLIATNYLFKVGIEALLTPVTYRVVNWLKRQENEDYFDIDTNFNPFALSDS
jgi:hypothetical protein